MHNDEYIIPFPPVRRRDCQPNKPLSEERRLETNRFIISARCDPCAAFYFLVPSMSCSKYVLSVADVFRRVEPWHSLCVRQDFCR